MRKLTLRSLWEHKRRLLSTVLAVVLGVSFMSGTFVMTTTLDKSFDDLFAKVVEDVDALVQGEVLYSNALGGDQRANLPAGTVDLVADVRGVAKAEPHVTTEGLVSLNRVLGIDGEPIGGAQSSTVLENWLEDEDLSPFDLVEGRQPLADDEMVLNVAAAEEGELGVGDEVTVVTQRGPEELELVGTFAFGSAKSVGGGITVGLTIPKVQEIAGLGDQITSIYVRGDDGVTQEELVERISPVLEGQTEVVTGDEAVAQLSQDEQTGFQFLTIALTVFGAIALLVGIFVISNTFSILVAQRTKELALLRALGASRTQVLGSVLLEAGVVGAVAAVIGLFGGLGLAKGVTAGMGAAGAALPSVDLVIEPDTIVLSIGIGVLVTLLASLLPALRATRVPPIAALRDVAIDRSNLSRARIGIGVVTVILGAFNLSVAWRSDGDTGVLPQVGLGAGLLVVGFLVVGPVLAGRTVRVIGSPLPRFRGVTGRLATENAARSPKRTSATASAVVIGVALVVFIQVFAASAQTSVHTEVERGFGADFVVTTAVTGVAFQPGIPSGVGDVVRGVAGVDLVSQLGFGSVGVQYPDGGTASHFASVFDPEAMGVVFSPRMVSGDPAKIGEDGVIVDKFVARDHDMKVGDPVIIIAPGGETAKLTLEGISNDRNLMGLVSMARGTYTAISSELLELQVAGTVQEGRAVEDVIADLEDALEDYPGVRVLDRDGFIGSIVDQITSYITLIQGLLVLSIITALVGIANTLSLSIGERTRELGLLRAVGMDRAEVRSTVRWEAALISALGALVGVSMGVLLSVAVLKAMQGLGLATVALPSGRLAVVLLLTSGLGTLAAVRPARRAASLSILDAISSE